MRKVSKAVGVVTGVGLMIVTSVATATTWYLQPASGRPWNGDQVTNETYDDNRTSIFDTGVCGNRFNVPGVWVTDVPITATNTTYDGEQNRDWLGDGSKVETRLASFNPSGSVYAISPATTNAALNRVSVPTNGSLFAQTTVVKNLNTQLRGYACLYSLKIWN